MKSKGKAIEAKAVNVEDLDVKYVLLESGKYLIDGEVVDVEYRYGNKSKVAVKNVDDIRIVKNIEINSHYENSDGEKISVENYKMRLEQLLKNAISDDDYGYYFSEEFLDDEYKYKKFKRDWNLIKKSIQQISDPIKVSVVTTKYETGNKYITNLLQHDKSDFNKILCQYNQPSAAIDILHEYMKSIGFQYVEDRNRYVIDKEWTNSTHSGITYAQAFGVYLFGSKTRWYRTKVMVGTLEDCLKWYEADKNEIEGAVKKKHMEKFGKIDETNFDFDSLLSKLKSASNQVSKVDSKVKTMTEYNYAKRLIKEIVEMVENKLEVK